MEPIPYFAFDPHAIQTPYIRVERQRTNFSFRSSKGQGTLAKEGIIMLERDLFSGRAKLAITTKHVDTKTYTHFLSYLEKRSKVFRALTANENRGMDRMPYFKTDLSDWVTLDSFPSGEIDKQLLNEFPNFTAYVKKRMPGLHPNETRISAGIGVVAGGLGAAGMLLGAALYPVLAPLGCALAVTAMGVGVPYAMDKRAQSKQFYQKLKDPNQETFDKIWLEIVKWHTPTVDKLTEINAKAVKWLEDESRVPAQLRQDKRDTERKLSRLEDVLQGFWILAKHTPGYQTVTYADNTNNVLGLMRKLELPHDPIAMSLDAAKLDPRKSKSQITINTDETRYGLAGARCGGCALGFEDEQLAVFKMIGDGVSKVQRPYHAGSPDIPSCTELAEREPEPEEPPRHQRKHKA